VIVAVEEYVPVALTFRYALPKLTALVLPALRTVKELSHE